MNRGHNSTRRPPREKKRSKYGDGRLEKKTKFGVVRGKGQEKKKTRNKKKCIEPKKTQQKKQKKRA